MVEIQIDPHTLARAIERGTSKEEIRDVINRGFSIAGKYGRLGRCKVYDFQQTRHGRYYEQRRVEVLEFISIKPSVAMASTVCESYATHSRLP